ncbi:MAG: hypothetical protein WD207_03500, partial [Xanthobacteraceae bacterium]
EVPRAGRDDALAEKWRKIRLVRRVVTGALEVERVAKRIGASLEAVPIIYVPDKKLFEITSSIDFAEVCITSAIKVLNEPAPEIAFKLNNQSSGLPDEIDKYPDAVSFSKATLDVTGVGVIVERAEGKKCARSWKISPLVGTDREFPDVTPRDAKALREFHAARRAAE